MNNTLLSKDGKGLSSYLSPLAVWALAFGCSVGWGAFVMPGTTFLPVAGPVGSALGLIIGAGIMLVIGVNYRNLMRRYPDAGGSYTYAEKVLGSDHGFLCAWMLLLTYMAVIWANSTALSLITRYLFGDVFCFGYLYELAGYKVYLGEVLLSVAVIAAACLVCVSGKRLAKWAQIICAVLLFACISVGFIAVVIHRGGFSGLLPAFGEKHSPAVQVLGIVILAPWAFIGFESISHSSEEFRFSYKKTLPVIIAALITGASAYIMLTICACLAVPDGFGSWTEYIAQLGSIDGIAGLPTFYGASQAMGTPGPVVFGIAAFCGIATGLIGNLIALSRLIYRLSDNGMMPKKLGTLNRHGIPAAAIICICAVSLFIPFFGRTAIGWIVDVTTIGAIVVYAYTCISSFTVGRREGDRAAQIWGAAGFVMAFVFGVIYMLPGLSGNNRLSTESYLILIIWSVLGMFVFRMLIRRDSKRRLGKSEVVWLILLLLVLLVSIVWIHQTTVDEASVIADDVRIVHQEQAEKAGLVPDSDIVRATGSYITNRIYEFGDLVRKNIFVQTALIVVSLGVIFSIFSIIKKREKQIEAEKLRAEEISKAKSTFLSNMSHDIRTPMNAITGYTALALRESDLPENVRDYLEKIDISGKHLLSLINDILDMSRIENGKLELDTQPGDLFLMFDEIYSVFAIQMRTKQIDFKVDHSGVSNRYAVYDKNRLSRVIINLVSNAYKFTPEGGSVTVAVRQTEYSPEAASYELTVTDTGIGMSDEFVEHLFDAFERERSMTVNSIEGTGLGMSIVKSLVEMMDGSISVATKQGSGTRFTIKLSFPIADESEIAVIADTASDTHEAVDFSSYRLLVVEDNPINSEIACMILSQEGFKTETAENGKVAVDMVSQAEEDRYSVILMDIQMPVMNGYDAAAAIRSLGGRHSQIPIIAITANTFEEDRKAALDAGMNAHVAKPFEPEKLIGTIAELLK